jgi:hypothetical protein
MSNPRKANARVVQDLRRILREEKKVVSPRLLNAARRAVAEARDREEENDRELVTAR